VGLRVTLERARRLVAPRWPQRRRQSGRNVVVLYHRIAETDDADPLGMVVAPDRFRRQLEALAATFQIVPAAEIRQQRTAPCAAITFDDGYADNAEVAAPVLRQLGLPATFFVTSKGFTSDREFWWDHLDHLMRGTMSVDHLTMRVGGARIRLDFAKADTRLAGLKQLNRVLIRQHPSVIAEVLDRLSGVSVATPGRCEAHRHMSVSQLLELDGESQFEIGSHTCSHAALGQLSSTDSREELGSSRRWLGDRLTRQPDLIAYPYGAPMTLRRRDVAQAADAGYTLGFVNVPGPADNAPAHVIPRVVVGQWEPDELLAAASRWRR
jgi:peptidoglycan/xylan/chitin deacetylase (PgdA/CDA1 family)